MDGRISAFLEAVLNQRRAFVNDDEPLMPAEELAAYISELECMRDFNKVIMDNTACQKETKPRKRREQSGAKVCAPGGPCSHCGATDSPQWRRPIDQTQILCNACGIYWGRHHKLPEHKKAPQFAATEQQLYEEEMEDDASPLASNTVIGIEEFNQPGSPSSVEGANQDTVMTDVENIDLPVAEEVVTRRPLRAVRTRCPSRVESAFQMAAQIPAINSNNDVYQYGFGQQPAMEQPQDIPAAIPKLYKAPSSTGSPHSPTDSNRSSHQHVMPNLSAADVGPLMYNPDCLGMPYDAVAAAEAALAAFNSYFTPEAQVQFVSQPICLPVQRVQSVPATRKRSFTLMDSALDLPPTTFTTAVKQGFQPVKEDVASAFFPQASPAVSSTTMMAASIDAHPAPAATPVFLPYMTCRGPKRTRLSQSSF